MITYSSCAVVKAAPASYPNRCGIHWHFVLPVAAAHRAVPSPLHALLGSEIKINLSITYFFSTYRWHHAAKDPASV